MARRKFQAEPYNFLMPFTTLSCQTPLSRLPAPRCCTRSTGAELRLWLQLSAAGWQPFAGTQGEHTHACTYEYMHVYMCAYITAHDNVIKLNGHTYCRRCCCCCWNGSFSSTHRHTHTQARKRKLQIFSLPAAATAINIIIIKKCSQRQRLRRTRRTPSSSSSNIVIVVE